MAVAVAKITWLLGLFAELGVTIRQPVVFCRDNRATMQIATNPIFHERTKHVKIDYHFIREKIKQGILAT